MLKTIRTICAAFITACMLMPAVAFAVNGNNQQAETAKTTAATPKIYVPITENFVGFKEAKGRAVTGLNNIKVKNCQELFKAIQSDQTAPKVSQREFINNNNIVNTFPECFVVGDSGVDLISNYLSTIYQWLAGIVGGVAVLMIIVGSIQIITGGSDQNNVTEGKTKIMQALSGLVILFLSGLILYTINPAFFS